MGAGPQNRGSAWGEFILINQPGTPSTQMAAEGITVVMCTYNGEAFVGQQLSSILSQTLAPAAIIVSDDGSDDQTLQIVETTARNGQVPIRILRNRERLGFAENFLQACDYVATPLIAFSDQDDIWAAKKLAKTYSAKVLHKAKLCVHSVEKIDSRGVLIERRRRPWTPVRVVEPLHSHPWGNFLGFTMLFDRALLDNIPRERRGVDPHTHYAKLSHDRWIYFLASTFGKTVIVNENLAKYRQHGSQLYGGTKRRGVRERFVTKLADGRTQATYLSAVAGARAAVLEDLAPAKDARTWLAGAAWWRAVESHLAGSAELYGHTSALQRLRLLGDNSRHGVYRSFKRGGLGMRRLIEDALVAISPLLKSGSRESSDYSPPAG